MRTKILAMICCVLALGQACSRDTKQSKADIGRDTSMANMPGMPGMTGNTGSGGAAPDSNSVAFTPAQIAHGGIAWAVPTSTPNSARARINST